MELIISVEEMKQYLRIDFDDDDALIENLIISSERLCMDIARIKCRSVFRRKDTAKVAVMYAVAYQYEHREDADHHKLEMTLRSLLSGIRKVGF
ncbi:head-tail connector protein [Clostridioides difficile]|uniref:head-tail connector protein n=1 Tax=Bacillota TaxID=1239 RepID=UPI0006D0CACC|nr:MULTISPECIES: head-tail connector protein [Bacillota]MCD3416495.1 head-tail connector protein [Streptococcus equi subsp. zooepidemicus]UUV09541.1 head-tail connector protein [Clostridioides difficile]HCU2976141.1 phage gp6-like head-tail connector protein [Clostridioides difficile]HCU3024538.1 phage gp6-like head-tail connector protein [Clostridioides difficile]HCU3028405.1 phage gp6-like head-tail connector protein [Clostridioides difficile]